ncbi:MAG TPA: alginate export family protein [Tepidisphaeraceae bacterium]|nr:alginate export family protein [Tepidisphaeraceae bacterium]
MVSLRGAVVLVISCAAAATPTAWAQVTPDNVQFERQLEQFRRDTRLHIDPDVPVGERVLLKAGAYYTFSYLSLDDPNFETRILRQHELTGYARVNVDGVHDFTFRARTGYQDFHRGDAFGLDGDDNDDVISPELERAVYRFDLQRHVAAREGRLMGGDVAVAAGRDLVYWASGLVLSQGVDGAAADITWGDAFGRLLIGQTASDTIDFDTSRPDFDDDTHRLFYGAMLGTRVGKHRPFLYALAQRDRNDDEPFVITSPTAQITTEFEYDSYYLGIGSTGAIGDRLVYSAELVYEGGSALSNSFNVTEAGTLEAVPQTNERIEAMALDVRLDYLLPGAHQTRLSAEAILATGDDDRRHASNTFGGNQPGTPDRSFNALGLLNTGVAFNPEVSNLALLRVGVSTFPAPSVSALRRLQLGTDVFVYRKFEKDAPIDEPTTDDRYLGFESDLFLNWRLTSDVTLAIRYGVFFPGDAIQNDDEPRHLFYTGVTFAF